MYRNIIANRRPVTDRPRPIWSGSADSSNIPDGRETASFAHPRPALTVPLRRDPLPNMTTPGHDSKKLTASGPAHLRRDLVRRGGFCPRHGQPSLPCRIGRVDLTRGLLGGKDVDHETERTSGSAAGRVVAVCEVGWNVKLNPASHLDPDKSLVPAFDDVATTELE